MKFFGDSPQTLDEDTEAPQGSAPTLNKTQVSQSAWSEREQKLQGAAKSSGDDVESLLPLVEYMRFLHARMVANLDKDKGYVDSAVASGPRVPYSRLRWSQLNDREKDAVKDSITVGAVRTLVGGGLGLGLLATVPTFLSKIGRPVSFGWGTKLMASILFPFTGGYAGLMSAGPLITKRILEIPDSRLARELQVSLDNRRLAFLLAVTQEQRVKKRDSLKDPELKCGR